MSNINLGDKVKDTVSGFVGIAVCETTYLQGCKRIGVQAITKNNAKPIDWVYFDEPQLKIIKRQVVKENSKRTGGIKPDAPYR